MKQIFFSLLALNILSFSAFAAGKKAPKLTQKLCGAVLSISDSKDSIWLQIRGGKADVIGEPFSRELLERVTDKELKAFGIKGRTDDLDALLTLHRGQNLLLAETIAPHIKNQFWTSKEQNTNSEYTLVLSAKAPTKDPLREHGFGIYEEKKNQSFLYGRAHLQFSSMRELQAAIRALENLLSVRNDSFNLVINTSWLHLFASGIELYSTRDEDNNIDFHTGSNGEGSTSGVGLFSYFLEKYGLRK